MTAIRKGVDHCLQDGACTQDGFKFHRGQRDPLICARKKTLIPSDQIPVTQNRLLTISRLTHTAKHTTDQWKLPDVGTV